MLPADEEVSRRRASSGIGTWSTRNSHVQSRPVGHPVSSRGDGGELPGAFGFPQSDVRLEVLHHAGELAEFEGLCPVGDGFFRSGMGLDDESISADGDAGFGDGRNETAFAGGMAGIENDGQVGKLVEDGDRGNVAGVARGGLEGADAAFAEDDVGIAVSGDVLGGHEQFLDGAAEATLEKNGAAAFAEGFEEHEVLHIARADLHHVGVLGDEVNVAVSHHLGDDGEAGGFLGFLEELETFLFESLKIVGRGARLEGAAAEEFRARFGHRIGGAHDLFLAFDRTRAGNDDKFVAADFRAVHADARFALTKFLGNEFVGSGDADDVVDLRESFDGFETGSDVAYTNNADDDTFLAFDGMDLVSEMLDDGGDRVDFFACGVELHGDDHLRFLVCSGEPWYRWCVDLTLRSFVAYGAPQDDYA